MFTLSGRFLEDEEYLFQDFWSPSSISFLHFSATRLKKKKKVNRLTGPCPARTLSPAGFISQVRDPRGPAARPRNPSAAASSRHRRVRAAASPPRRAAPPRPPAAAAGLAEVAAAAPFVVFF